MHTRTHTHTQSTDVQTIRASDWHLQTLFCSVSTELIVGLTHYFFPVSPWVHVHRWSKCVFACLEKTSKFPFFLWSQRKQNGSGRDFIPKMHIKNTRFIWVVSPSSDSTLVSATHCSNTYCFSQIPKPHDSCRLPLTATLASHLLKSPSLLLLPILKLYTDAFAPGSLVLARLVQPQPKQTNCNQYLI